MQTRTRLLPLLVLAGLCSIAIPAPGVAQLPPGGVPPREGAPHPEAEKAIDRLRSPYCPGLMLEVCPSPNAALLRDSIAMLAEGGMESGAIVEWMLGNHGEEWRAVPLTRGAGLWAWLGPPIAVVAGAIGLMVALVRIRRRRSQGVEADAPPPLSESDQARLRAALREVEALEEPVI